MPAICEGKMGKKVKVHGKMMKNKDRCRYMTWSLPTPASIGVAMAWRASAFEALLFSFSNTDCNCYLHICPMQASAKTGRFA